MEQQIFCDGIGRISVIGGVVRLDLMVYSPSETDAAGQPRAVLTHRVVMGAEGFLRSSHKVLEVAQQLTQSAQVQAAPQPQRAPQPAPMRREPVPSPPAPPVAEAPPPIAPKKPFP